MKCRSRQALFSRSAGPADPVLLLAALAALAALSLAGCDRAPQPVSAPAPDPAERILLEMIAAYRQAPTYADRGVVRLRYRRDGNWVQDEGKLSVRFQRPNRLLIRAYQLTLASDGSRRQASVADPASGNLDGQIAVGTSPARLTLENLYEDPLVVELMASGMGGPPVSLELLLSDKPLTQLLGQQVVREPLSEASIDDHPCDRVRIAMPEGPLVLWIDQHSRLLRRLEYPVGQLAAQLDPSGRIRDLSLVAEMREAAFGVDLSGEAFRFDVPQDAKLVQRFVLPPPPLPSPLFGRQPAEFRFSDAAGRLVAQQDLLGKPAVLVWFNVHPASEACLRRLTQLTPPLSEDPRIACYAVCTEPAETTNRQLEQLAGSWGLSWPLLRDLQAVGRDVFQIPAAPTLVVLDAQGVVQVFEVGAGPEVANMLPQVLGELLRGEDLAGSLLTAFRQQQAQYQQALSETLQPPAASAIGQSPLR